MSEKVTVLLQHVGDAPILKQKKFSVDRARTIAWFTQTIRKLMALEDNQNLFFYISQTFAPSPDHTFEALKDCYALTGGDVSNDHLVLHYSTTPAWG
ncbi:hypothetical protein WR25_16313 [Diploscapter pachys]|uniref:Ubiquitin-like protein ATG12 n=1 Tax=Diploscapter pachys TaxID=2018661 RepID=A0A2A2JCY0_9BILA|nr:hypothetical protein WR25_16313 [Diploscapter pachys]